jgi:DNA-3-methyladenine glycosylase II
MFENAMIGHGNDSWHEREGTGAGHVKDSTGPEYAQTIEDHPMPRVNYQRARLHLMRADPAMATLVKAHGPCGLATRAPHPPLRALARALVGQQLSAKAAETIFRRFIALFPGDGFPSPDLILEVPAARLREIGLSWRKAEYLHDLCRRMLAGTLPLDSLRAMSDDEVMETLTAVKGIGRWTAEMLLIFQLGRPDVLPLDDVGLQRAVKQVYGLRRRPTPKQFTRLAEKWRPYRSLACWYLWAELDKK